MLMTGAGPAVRQPKRQGIRQVHLRGMVRQESCPVRPSRKRRAMLSGTVILVLLLSQSFTLNAAPSADRGVSDDISLSLLHAEPVAQQAETPLLELNSLVKKELASGAAHTYRLSLSAGKFVKVPIQPQGIP